MARVYNFSAGPSTLPEKVLKQAADEMMDYQGCGQSVMEMSHRSKVFDKIIKDAEALMRELTMFLIITKYYSFRVVHQHSFQLSRLIL